MVKTFGTRFNALSNVIFDVTTGDMQIDISNRLDEQEPKGKGKASYKRSLSNLQLNKKAFADRLRDFVGLIKN